MIKQECVNIKYTHTFCMKVERRKEFHHFQKKFLFHKPTSLNCVILFKSCRQIFESSAIFDNRNLIELGNLTCCREGAFQATQRFSHDLQRGELTRRRFKKVLQEVLKNGNHLDLSSVLMTFSKRPLTRKPADLLLLWMFNCSCYWENNPLFHW